MDGIIELVSNNCTFGVNSVTMNKRVLFLILLIGSMILASCEEDDICVGEGTPNLTVVFRNDFNTQNLKDTLTIYASNSIDFENSYLLYDKVFSDSLKLPLGGLNEEIIYYKIQRRSNSVSDILTVNYQPTTEYVSKACGFRLTYEGLQYQTTQNYINYLIPNESNELKDETETDLYIVLSN